MYDINHSKFLYDPPPRILEIKTKINKWDLIKLKRFFTAKKVIDREFAGGPMIRAWPFTAVALDSIPGQGTKIPQATQLNQERKKENH